MLFVFLLTSIVKQVKWRAKLADKTLEGCSTRGHAWLVLCFQFPAGCQTIYFLFNLHFYLTFAQKQTNTLRISSDRQDRVGQREGRRERKKKEREEKKMTAQEARRSTYAEETVPSVPDDALWNYETWRAAIDCRVFLKLPPIRCDVEDRKNEHILRQMSQQPDVICNDVTCSLRNICNIYDKPEQRTCREVWKISRSCTDRGAFSGCSNFNLNTCQCWPGLVKNNMPPGHSRQLCFSLYPNV